MNEKSVVCKTARQFQDICDKWVGKGEIRGSQLLSCGKVIAEYKPTRGGYKVGSGRPRGNRNVTMTVKISPEAHDKLSTLTDNKSEYIDSLILRQ